MTIIIDNGLYCIYIVIELQDSSSASSKDGQDQKIDNSNSNISNKRIKELESEMALLNESLGKLNEELTKKTQSNTEKDKQVQVRIDAQCQRFRARLFTMMFNETHIYSHYKVIWNVYYLK